MLGLEVFVYLKGLILTLLKNTRSRRVISTHNVLIVAGWVG